MSNYIMQTELFGMPVRCETDGLMVSLTDITRAGNKWRVAHDLPLKTLVSVLESNSFAEFKAVVEADLPAQQVLVVQGRGNSKRTMAHIILAVYVAQQFSAEFHYQVIKHFVEGKLLEFRELGGTEFRALNAAIDLYLPGRESRNNRGCYINVATILNRRITGELGEPLIDWANATVAQTHKRYEAEKKLVSFLEAGLVRDWEHLKELCEKI